MQVPLSDAELAGLIQKSAPRRTLSNTPLREEPVMEVQAEEWPSLKEEALQGLVGEAVKTIEPFTEADPVALLINLLTAFGNVIGVRPHFLVDFDKHHMRLFSVLVGKSGAGAKGRSWSTPRRILTQVDIEWVERRITGGLSSGEGLIYEVRDPLIKKSRKKGEGQTTYEEEIVDHGVSDKRLLLIEEEFAQALKVMAREGNILSTIIRRAWDNGNIRAITKQNPIRATGAHISIVGHITRDELLRHLNETEQANGFGNRFLWFLVRRSKCIPNPKGVPLSSLDSLISQVAASVNFARQVDLMTRDAIAEQVWSGVYEVLSEEKPGIFGSLLARAPAQVMRLACIYALMDRSAVVNVPHLNAALALWEYCEESARLIFGESIGDPYADRILEELKSVSEPMRETEIWRLFGGHGGQRVPQALKILERMGLVSKKKGLPENGRPPILWSLAKKAKEAKKVPSGGHE